MSVIKGEVGERVGEWEYGSMVRARRQGVGGAAKREQRDQSVKGNNNGVASANAAVHVNVDVEKKIY